MITTIKQTFYIVSTTNPLVDYFHQNKDDSDMCL